MLTLSDPQRRVLRFVAKMFAAYVGWYVLYDLWLLPAGWLDEAVAKHAAVLTGGLLDVLGMDVAVDGRIVWVRPQGGITIVDECTGLAVVGLFIGFVLAYPGSGLRRLWFLPLGALVIHLANVGRLALLAWLTAVRPELFDAAHEWGLLPFFYAVVFVLWMAWVRYGTVPAAQPVLAVS